MNEHWIDLNRNGDTQPQPDLPGVGELGKEKDYRDGFLSDLKLQMDPQRRNKSTARFLTKRLTKDLEENLRLSDLDGYEKKMFRTFPDYERIFLV